MKQYKPTIHEESLGHILLCKNCCDTIVKLLQKEIKRDMIRMNLNKTVSSNKKIKKSKLSSK